MNSDTDIICNNICKPIYRSGSTLYEWNVILVFLNPGAAHVFWTWYSVTKKISLLAPDKVQNDLQNFTYGLYKAFKAFAPLFISYLLWSGLSGHQMEVFPGSMVRSTSGDSAFCYSVPAFLDKATCCLRANNNCLYFENKAETYIFPQTFIDYGAFVLCMCLSTHVEAPVSCSVH